jgi:hypothetical protein
MVELEKRSRALETRLGEGHDDREAPDERLPD